MNELTERLSSVLADRYRIERELGQGGMATVYLAHDLKHDRKVALKVLSPDLAATLGHERFLREITNTANLRHPHILPLFDSGDAGSFLYYVMPYVEGETLRSRLDRDRQLPLDESVRITTEVATTSPLTCGALRHSCDKKGDWPRWPETVLVRCVRTMHIYRCALRLTLRCGRNGIRWLPSGRCC
jgi:serine/threonine protein kinase